MKLWKGVEYTKILQGYHPGESVVESQLWKNCCVYIIKVEPDDRKDAFTQQQTLKRYGAWFTSLCCDHRGKYFVL